MREGYQVLVIPFIHTSELNVAIFQRSDDQNWQFISGGGENNEKPVQAAKRESFEEAGIESDNKFIKLDTVSSIPKENFSNHKNQKGIWIIPEYCFAVKLESRLLRISSEHKLVKWASYDEAMLCLKYDSNKIALWELRQRIIENDIKV